MRDKLSDVTAFTTLAMDVAGILSDDMTAVEIAQSFTCSEAETITDFLIAAGHIDGAKWFLDNHSRGDEPGDDHYNEETSS